MVEFFDMLVKINGCKKVYCYFAINTKNCLHSLLDKGNFIHSVLYLMGINTKLCYKYRGIHVVDLHA